MSLQNMSPFPSVLTKPRLSVKQTAWSCRPPRKVTASFLQLTNTLGRICGSPTYLSKAILKLSASCTQHCFIFFHRFGLVLAGACRQLACLHAPIWGEFGGMRTLGSFLLCSFCIPTSRNPCLFIASACCPARCKMRKNMVTLAHSFPWSQQQPDSRRPRSGQVKSTKAATWRSHNGGTTKPREIEAGFENTATQSSAALLIFGP